MNPLDESSEAEKVRGWKVNVSILLVSHRFSFFPVAQHLRVRSRALNERAHKECSQMCNGVLGG